MKTPSSGAIPIAWCDVMFVMSELRRYDYENQPCPFDFVRHMSQDALDTALINMYFFESYQ